MNYVYFPAPVVLILRRLANVISTLSISNQYILAKSARSEELTDGAITEERQPEEPPAPSSWDTIHALRWPTWMNRNTWQWPHFMTVGGPQFADEAARVKVPELALKCVCFTYTHPR